MRFCKSGRRNYTTNNYWPGRREPTFNRPYNCILIIERHSANTGTGVDCSYPQRMHIFRLDRCAWQFYNNSIPDTVTLAMCNSYRGSNSRNGERRRRCSGIINEEHLQEVVAALGGTLMVNGSKVVDICTRQT